MVNQKIGSLTPGNYGNAMESMDGLSMKMSRDNASQNFNNYRRKLALNPYRSFYDLTENDVTVELLYWNVNDVEQLTGNRRLGFLSIVQIITNSVIVNSILTNPLNGEDAWKSDTFGGNEGFGNVRIANIETFVRNNYY